VDEVNEFHIYVLHPEASFPFGRKSRATGTPEESGKDSGGKDVTGRSWQRTFENHHNAEGCSPRGRIEWSDWSAGNSTGETG
jgi:hypothetical protein